MNMEMSSIDPDLPRYYKGHDMDDLMCRMQNMELLTAEEKNIILEAQKKYYAAKFEKNRKQMKAIEEQHKNEPFVGQTSVNIWNVKFPDKNN